MNNKQKIVFSEQEQEVEKLIKNGGRFGKGKANNLVRKQNLELFKNWDEELLGDKAQHLVADGYRDEFLSIHPFITKR